MNTLLLPGMDGTGLLFEPLLRELPAALGAKAVAYPAGRGMGYDELEESVRPFIPAVGPWALVAESFSGPLAVRLAARYPDRLQGLVLACGFVECPARWLARLAFLSGPASALPPIGLSFFIRQFLLGSDAPEPLVALAREVIRPLRREVRAARLRAVAAVDERESLRSLRTPILLLTGERDRLVGPHAIRRLYLLCPDARVVTLDAPHMVLQRRPAEAAAEIAQFLTPEACDGPTPTTLRDQS